jgi:hypothetical protein
LVDLHLNYTTLEKPIKKQMPESVVTRVIESAAVTVKTTI